MEIEIGDISNEFIVTFLPLNKLVITNSKHIYITGHETGAMLVHAEAQKHPHNVSNDMTIYLLIAL